MTIRIESYAAHHRNSLIEMILEIQQDEFNLPITYGEQKDLHDISAAYRIGAGQFWVAQAPNTLPDHVVGSLGLHDMGTDGVGKRVGALRKMFVRKDFRGGGEQGAAALLLKTLEEHCRRHGIVALYLGTTEAFKAAHRFYQKRGYTPMSADDLPENFVRLAVDTRFYTKAL
ncbi:MAG: GCN5-related N-acetyltransferase [Alphaproteobacteria bacterium]|jgi:N-acetylglutamate synthase-like GNAT family acetyltransferase|nr:GCN5-related N-acetyltransferase [Alphaproteobacteria bacterium]